MKYLVEFCEKFEYPLEATKELKRAYKKSLNHQRQLNRLIII